MVFIEYFKKDKRGMANSIPNYMNSFMVRNMELIEFINKNYLAGKDKDR